MSVGPVASVLESKGMRSSTIWRSYWTPVFVVSSFGTAWYVTRLRFFSCKKCLLMIWPHWTSRKCSRILPSYLRFVCCLATANSTYAEARTTERSFKDWGFGMCFEINWLMTLCLTLKTKHEGLVVFYKRAPLNVFLKYYLLAIRL